VHTPNALHFLKVDELGLEQLDREYLSMITQKFGGGPVGLDTLSTAIGEERGTLEDMVEPYLIQQGFIMRTPRGRSATHLAYAHLGLKSPDSAADLFNGQ
jgi:Holliday junction DNA helicase RuvB